MNLPPQCCKITALLTASTLSKAEMKPKFKYERDWERERKKQKIKWCQFWCFIWLSITAPHLITIFFLVGFYLLARFRLFKNVQQKSVEFLNFEQKFCIWNIVKWTNQSKVKLNENEKRISRSFDCSFFANGFRFTSVV